jgi:hypothetical protein
VITAAALCPATPLLVPALTGSDPVAADLRQACLGAVSEVAATAPEVIAVIGAAEQTRDWDPAAVLDPAIFAPGIGGESPAAEPGLPPSVGVGTWLLTEAGYRGPRQLRSVGSDEPADRCAKVGAALAAVGGRTGLLVMADGSARRSLKAPGYLDQRSEAFDAEIERAILGGDLAALLDVDARLARELLATGIPALQALAGALAGPVTAHVSYCGAPFGVGYLVASLRPG